MSTASSSSKRLHVETKIDALPYRKQHTVLKKFKSVADELLMRPDFPNSACMADIRKTWSEKAFTRCCQALNDANVKRTDTSSFCVFLEHEIKDWPTITCPKYRETIFFSPGDNLSNSTSPNQFKLFRSPYRGVSVHPALQKWRTRMKHGGVSRHLGYSCSDLVCTVLYNLASLAVSSRQVEENKARVADIPERIVSGSIKLNTKVIAVVDIAKMEAIYGSLPSYFEEPFMDIPVSGQVTPLSTPRIISYASADQMEMHPQLNISKCESKESKPKATAKRNLKRALSFADTYDQFQFATHSKVSKTDFSFSNHAAFSAIDRELCNQDTSLFGSFRNNNNIEHLPMFNQSWDSNALLDWGHPSESLLDEYEKFEETFGDVCKSDPHHANSGESPETCYDNDLLIFDWDTTLNCLAD